jgi:FkbM family methyltransferase
VADEVVVRTPLRSLKLMLKRQVLSWLLGSRSPHRHGSFAVIPGDAVSGEVLVAGLYEEGLLVPLFTKLLEPLLASFSRGAALDVGANIGNHSLFFARYFRAVCAFEPNPTALAVLECNVNLAGLQERVRVMRFGLSDRDAVLEFVENEAGNLGHSGFEYAGLRQGKRVVCPVRQGDHALKQHGVNEAIALIKVDVEGAELSVLRGLEQTIRSHQPVIMFESLHAHGPSGGNAIVAYLRSLGYGTFYAVDDRTSSMRPLQKIWVRMLKGERTSFIPIESLSDRKYPLVVAIYSMPANGAQARGETRAS